MNEVFRFLQSVLLSATATLFTYGVICIPLEFAFPSIRTQRRWRKDSTTDAAYWLMMPVLAVISTAVLSALGWSSLHPRIAVGHWPIWAQVLTFAFIVDFIQYWWHRLMHCAPLWRIHAPHHSATELDWLSSFRRHPLEVLAWSVLIVWMKLIGFSPAASATFATFSAFTGFLPHANLSWTYGPLRYLFVSPIFHRWHHTQTDEGGMKNFANLFSCIDLAFGTFYMPANRQPSRFGLGDGPAPLSLSGQLSYPFVRHR